MTVILRSPAAERDLEDIWYRIARDNPTAADRMLRAIGRRIRFLAEHPRLGRRREDIRVNTRVLIEWPYLILYATVPDTDAGEVLRIEIIRVLDGRQDLGRLR